MERFMVYLWKLISTITLIAAATDYNAEMYSRQDWLLVSIIAALSAIWWQHQLERKNK